MAGVVPGGAAGGAAGHGGCEAAGAALRRHRSVPVRVSERRRGRTVGNLVTNLALRSFSGKAAIPPSLPDSLPLPLTFSYMVVAKVDLSDATCSGDG